MLEKRISVFVGGVFLTIAVFLPQVRAEVLPTPSPVQETQPAVTSSPVQAQAKFIEFWGGSQQENAAKEALQVIVGGDASLDGIEAFAPKDTDLIYAMHSNHLVFEINNSATMTYRGVSYHFYHKTVKPSDDTASDYGDIMAAEYEKLRAEYARTELAYKNKIAPRMEKIEIEGIPHLISMYGGEEVPRDVDQELLEKIAEKLGRLHGLGFIHGHLGSEEPDQDKFFDSEPADLEDYRQGYKRHILWDPSTREVCFIDFGHIRQSRNAKLSFDKEKKCVEEMFDVEKRGLKDLFERAYNEGLRLVKDSKPLP